MKTQNTGPSGARIAQSDLVAGVRNTASVNAKPPASNKGGNTLDKPSIPDHPTVSIQLDWLRYSVAYNPNLSEGDNLRVAMPRFPEFSLTGEEQQNGRGYNRAQKLTIGVIHWHDANPAQGISVELTGSDLAQSRKADIEELDLLRHVAALYGKVSTMDSAIDVYRHNARPRDILTARDNDTLRTSVKDIGEYANTKLSGGVWRKADTVYVGSPKSDRQMKVYNKAAQVGIPGDWIRIEMRWRGPFARAAHQAMLNHGIAETTRAAVLSMVDFDARWWRVALTGPLADIEPVGRKETKTLDWLMGAVLNTLDRELHYEQDRGERELYDAFEAVIAKYARRRDINMRGKR